MFQVRCECGKEVGVKAAQAGSLVDCPACGAVLNVPSLRGLHSFASRNVAAPAASVPSLQASASSKATAEGLPESFFVHCCGEVSSVGRVSATAMANYVGIVLSRVDSMLESAEVQDGYELLVSCALLPAGKQWIDISVNPPQQMAMWTEELESAIRKITPPPVQGGPVAFAFYRRKGLAGAAMSKIAPFPKLSQSIESLGLEAALMQAVNPEPSRGLTIWQKLRRKLFPAKRPVETPVSLEDEYRQQVQWLSRVDELSEQESIVELKRRVVSEPHELAHHVALASKYAATEQWELSVRAYTGALKLAADCAPLLARRAGMHVQAGNSQAGLVDYNRAIELAPFEALFYYWRAEIYTSIEAWQQAKEDLAMAIELAPHDPAMLLSRAQLYAHLEEFEPAIADLHKTLILDPNCGLAHLMLGRLLQFSDLRDRAEAIPHFCKAIELMPNDLSTRIYRSLAYLAENKFALALEDCDQVLAADPESASAFGIRGRVLQLEGEYEAAIDASSRAIDLGLEHAMVYLSRAISYAATNQEELANADCEAALALEPDNALACQLHGQLNLQNGDLDAAMQAFHRARELAPDWVEPREHLAYVHRMKENPQAAIEEQTELIDKQPKQAAHYVNRAFALVQLGKFELALQDYNRAVELDPENEQIIYFRGTFYFQRQEYDLALADLNRVLTIDSDNDAARLYRAHVFLHLKRHDEAVEDYAQLIAKFPEDPRAYSGRAYVLGATGNNKAAREDIERLNEIIPEQSEMNAVHTLLGQIALFKQQGRSTDAMPIAEQLIELAPDEPVGHRARAGLHWDNEEFVEAYDDYTRAIELEEQAGQMDEAEAETQSNPGLLSARGQVQAEMGEWESALLDLEQAVDLSRKSGEKLTLAFALNGRSLALAELGRIEESNRDYEESVGLCPTNPWVYYHRGLRLFHAGNMAEAKVLLGLSLELQDPPLPPRKRNRVELALSRIAAAQTP